MNGCVIPHTPIAVDFWKIRECPQVRIFFLTHLHGDHTAGLTSSWRYPIYCSEITGRLLMHIYGIKKELINILQVDCASIIYLDSQHCQQMTVTALDANHCPGAVMFLMESYFGTILHTGDFRFQPEMLQNPTLSRHAGNIDILYLDNTYCSPGCEFPSREQATKAIIKIIKDHPLHDILIAMRNIGKEELLCSIATHLKDWISVPTRVYNILEILGAPDVFDNSSTNHRIKIVPFNVVSRKFVERVNAVSPTIVIIPTALYCGLDIQPYVNEENVFVVPYSDHSSFKELEEFVAFVKPKKIIPIVKATARGPFGTSIVNRADMSCFRNIIKDDWNKKVEIPISVQAFMNANGINMVLRCGNGVKRKKMKLCKSESVKRMKRGIIYENTESVSSEKGQNSHTEETYNVVSEHINESAKGDSLECSVAFKEHPNTTLKYKIDTCVKDEQKKLEQHTPNEELCSTQDIDDDFVKIVEQTKEETDAKRPLLDSKEDSKFDKEIVPKTQHFPAKDNECAFEPGIMYFIAEKNEDSLEAEPETQYFAAEENVGSLEVQLGTQYFPAEDDEDSLEVKPGTQFYPAEENAGALEVELGTQYFTANENEDSLEVELGTPYFPAENDEDSLEVAPGTQHFSAEENESLFQVEPETQYFTAEENEGSLEVEPETQHFPGNVGRDSLEVKPGTQHFPAEDDNIVEVLNSSIDDSKQDHDVEKHVSNMTVTGVITIEKGNYMAGSLDAKAHNQCINVQNKCNSQTVLKEDFKSTNIEQDSVPKFYKRFLRLSKQSMEIPFHDHLYEKFKEIDNSNVLQEQFIATKLVIDKSDENEVCASDKVIEKNCRLSELNAFKQVFKMHGFSVPAERNLGTCNIQQPIETISNYFYSSDCHKDKNENRCSQINILSTEKRTVFARRRKLNQIFSRI